MGQKITQEVRLEVMIRFDPNSKEGMGEYFISDCRAEAITQVDPTSAVTAKAARDTAYDAVNQFLKQQNEVLKANYFVKTGASL